jgi:hypothetical protein
MAEMDSTNEDRLDLLTDALPQTIAIFKRLDDEGRERLLKTVSTIFKIGSTSEPVRGPVTVSYGESTGKFSKEQSLSPKEFLMKKQPRSDVERVACLAYYLAHYRDQPTFKTLDISNLNTEAAQTKLSNSAYAVNNATQYGYLAAALKGAKQLSGAGEMYVEALPDRDAAAKAFAHSRPKRASKRKKVPVNG